MVVLTACSAIASANDPAMLNELLTLPPELSDAAAPPLPLVTLATLVAAAIAPAIVLASLAPESVPDPAVEPVPDPVVELAPPVLDSAPSVAGALPIPAPVAATLATVKLLAMVIPFPPSVPNTWLVPLADAGVNSIGWAANAPRLVSLN